EDVKILVAEDNEINQSLIKHLFKNWSLACDIVNNGKEAIDILQTKTYNLVLMDIQMPEMDGYTATREIRDDLKLEIPIVAMTAHAFAGEREKCLSYGMNDYISKPIREDELRNLISQFTQNKQMAETQKREVVKPIGSAYKYINLKYMKEISNGNIEYEKTVTKQFIDVISEEIVLLEKASEKGQHGDLRQLAHNMKTTISVMGLNELLQPYLDALEYEDVSADKLQSNISFIKSICTAAIAEAQLLYSSY
ncbi:MAG: response regulator, partial [Ginsengibacter sp.]